MIKPLSKRFPAKAEEAPKLLLPKQGKLPQVPTDRLVRDKEPAPERLLIYGDAHFGIVDQYAFNAMMAFARDAKPDHIACVGDMYDFWSTSSFSKEPERWLEKGGRLQEEFDSGEEAWSEFCNIADKVTFIHGNHEGRLGRHIAENAGFYKLKAFEDWHLLANIPEKVKIYPYGSRIEVGTIWLEHGDKIGGQKHRAEWALANRVGQNTVFGHWHLSEMRHRTVLGHDGPKIFVSHALGHLSDLKKQTYAGPSPDWQHGFAFVEFYKVGSSTRFTFHSITIVNGRFMFGGKLYNGRAWQ